MIKLAAPLVIAATLAAGCASQRASNSFAMDGILAREAIELHGDGTFVYCAFSDDGPTEFSARGTWRWVDRTHRRLETVVHDRTVKRGYPSASDDLPDVVVWSLAPNTIHRPNRPPMKRSTTGDGCESLR